MGTGASGRRGSLDPITSPQNFSVTCARLWGAGRGCRGHGGWGREAAKRRKAIAQMVAMVLLALFWCKSRTPSRPRAETLPPGKERVFHFERAPPREIRGQNGLYHNGFSSKAIGHFPRLHRHCPKVLSLPAPVAATSAAQARDQIAKGPNGREGRRWRGG